MFSSSVSACKDAEGRFFIDRPGTFFHPILDYPSVRQVPKQHFAEVYREAQFYAIQPVVKLLEEMPHIFDEQVSWQQFLLQVPSYSENLELLLCLAWAEAVGGVYWRWWCVWCPVMRRLHGVQILYIIRHPKRYQLSSLGPVS
ncbi:BTB/POZ domain-containing protein KCTD14 [Fukomys damarensis]|uniref:BTB/POZ domain-containing protein KCTD14 n=1 Tax=Fukomys damarensis TaxID=885580 RepID=A0A091E4L3_FUKDA|nr:BTB/POZ domain-containing protein KCTD14 [Fukomys damarensis]